MMPVVKRTNWLPNVLFNDLFENDWAERSRVSNPAMNVVENDNEYRVELATPGLSKEDFHIEMREDKNLVISMEKKAEAKEEDKNIKYLRREFSYMSFRKNLILPEDINEEKIEAKMENGVLTVVIPKVKEEEKPQPKQIQIN